MDMVMDYEKTKKLGVEILFEFLQALYPYFELYSISIDWLKSKEFIAKAKGINGDVLIRWYE